MPASQFSLPMVLDAPRRGDLPSPAFSQAPSVYVGIDENGLGPRLGPLLVTAAWARPSANGLRVLRKPPSKALADRLGDSKKLVSFGDSALGEAWARVLLERRGGGNTYDTPTAVLRALSIDSDAALRVRCPENHESQCWGNAYEAFEAPELLMSQVRRDVDSLAARGVELEGVRLAIVCTERINDATARGVSRFDLDLHAMERLVLAVVRTAFVEGSAERLDATCGKVGGIDFYGPRFRWFDQARVRTVAEGRARSDYDVDAIGRVSFVRDADEDNLLVGLASLVGKWARDLLMRRIVEHHRRAVPDLPMASGYNDPVTGRFVEASRLARARSGLPDACFERAKSKTATSRPSPAQRPERPKASP